MTFCNDDVVRSTLYLRTPSDARSAKPLVVDLPFVDSSDQRSFGRSHDHVDGPIPIARVEWPQSRAAQTWRIHQVVIDGGVLVVFGEAQVNDAFHVEHRQYGSWIY